MITNKLTIASILMCCLLLSACAAGDPQYTQQGLAGFWHGLWHGMISTITFIIGLFNDNVKIYEFHNNGSWYDFGFIMGCTGSSGSASVSAARRGQTQ